MKVRSNAKVNLGLSVGEVRSDGYHNIESLILPVYDFFDTIEFFPRDGQGEVEIEVSGCKIPGKREDNSCVLAYKALSARYSLPSLKIRLNKNIPAGSGLGGGSSNATFTLKALNELFKLGLKRAELMEFAVQLGSDCPFFMDNKPAIVKGRGEVTVPVDFDLNRFRIELHLNEYHISTKEAFENIRPGKGIKYSRDLLADPSRWRNELRNDFEDYVLQKHPSLSVKIKEIYKRQVHYASVTGSGSALFSIRSV